MICDFEIEIQTVTHTRGPKAGEKFYSVWFWSGGRCEHIGFFGNEYDAKSAADGVKKSVELVLG